jgi:hypothetical protein
VSLLSAIRNRLPSLRRVEISKGVAFEFQKNKVYVVMADRNFLTQKECHTLSKVMANKGVTNVTFVLGRVNPAESIAVMEQKS